jgi:hypothetical protein
MPYMGRTIQPGLENMGLAWKQNEIDQLLNEIKEKKEIKDIAVLHKRTIGGIRSRLREIAAAYFINDSKPIPEIMEITGLAKDDIIDAISKREYRDELKSKKNTNKINKITEEQIISPTVQKKTEKSELQEILVALKTIEKRVADYIKERSIFDE